MSSCGQLVNDIALVNVKHKWRARYCKNEERSKKVLIQERLQM